jgi:pimeloyl-ACP methyl ester carboxylesterase
VDGWAAVAGTRVGYRLIDRGSPDAVLMLHGLGGDRRGLLELAELLPDVTVVLPDLPGYGESEPLPEPHTLAAYARFVTGFRMELSRRPGLNPCHLLGHSLGASIALVHAAGVHRADAMGLRSLCLLNPVSTAKNLSAALGKTYYQIAAHVPAPFARFWLTSRPAVHLADLSVLRTKDRRRRRLILEQDYENYRRASVPAMIESFLSCSDTPFEALAADIAAPALLVTGDRDGIAPAVSASQLARRMPDGRSPPRRHWKGTEMRLHWREAETIALRPGYYLNDATGEQVQTASGVRVACEGGFLHVDVPGSPLQIVSAPAVWHISLPGVSDGPDEYRDSR